MPSERLSDWLRSKIFGSNPAPLEVAWPVACGLLGSAIALGSVDTGGFADWRSWLLAMIAFDVFGGVAANTTPAAKRRDSGPQARRQAIVFALGHVQPYALTAAFPILGISHAALLHVVGVACTAVVAFAPSPVRNSMALAVYVLALSALVLFLPRGWEWLAVGYLAKLIAARAAIDQTKYG